MSVDRVAVPALPPAVAGEGPARRTSVPYLLGLVAVASAMLALPVLYAALVLLAAWGVWRHATLHLVLLQSGAWLAVPLYFGPLAAGLVLVVFLVKPLFARGAPPPPAIPLDPEHEPALFEFVERIGELVGAPRPRRIQVNCTVNAAAWFRRGAASFLGQDLTMTLGLPLVAGLSTRQLAGIVAHELGHFTQGAGMRLTYVIRQVNNWLARVVFEPDAWDLRMEAAARSGNGAVLLVLRAARSGVWLTRRLLWLFLHLGHAASCFMLRQMEKDADVCECRVAGSDTVRDATLRVRELEAAGHWALFALRDSWRSRRLPDSLPHFILETAEELPADVRQQIRRHVSQSQTGLFDTHPSDADRIRAAEALGAPGVVRSEEPATSLFRDFPSLCRRATRLSYAKEQALPVRGRNLVDTGRVLRESRSLRAAREASARYFQGVTTIFHPISVGRTTPRGLQRDLADLRSARERMASTAAAARSAKEEREQIEVGLGQAHTALALLSAGFNVVPAEFGLDAATPAAARAAIARLEERGRQCGTALQAHTRCAAARLEAALRLSADRSLDARLGDARRLREETARLVSLLAALAGVLPPLWGLGRRAPGLQLLLHNRGRCRDAVRLEEAIRSVAGDMRGLVDTVKGGLRGLSYPFPHARGPITLGQLVEPDTPAADEPQAVLGAAHACLEQLPLLYQDVLDRLAGAATRVEEALAP
jgi:Zn-dependent protease with chaperone function